MQEAVNIREYLDIFKRRKWIIIVLVLLSLVVGGYKTYKNYTSYVPTYTSTVTVRINTMKEYEKQQAKQKNKSDNDKNDTNDTSNNNVSNYYNTYSSTAEMQNQNIASSYVGLTTKEQFRKKVAAISNIKMSEIGSVVATQNTEIPTFVDIKVVSPSAEIAKKVAESAPEAFNQELIEIAKVDCVEVVYEPSTPVLIPRAKDRTMVKYLAAAIVVSIFLVLLVECLDTRIKTPNDVDKYWDLPLIGVIPLDDGKQKSIHQMQSDDVQEGTSSQKRRSSRNNRNGKNSQKGDDIQNNLKNQNTQGNKNNGNTRNGKNNQNGGGVQSGQNGKNNQNVGDVQSNRNGNNNQNGTQNAHNKNSRKK